MIDFFENCIPPTTTAQMKRINRSTGTFFKSDKQSAAEATFYAVCMPHKPRKPVPGPVKLTVTFWWPWRAKDSKKVRALGSIPMTEKPDADNAVKELQDILAALRFIEKDSQVSDLIVRKRRGDHPGIRIQIETITQEEV